MVLSLFLWLLASGFCFEVALALDGSCALEQKNETGAVFLAYATGLITDGSPEGKTYLPQEHECAWTIGGKGEEDGLKTTTRITLALEYFNSVLGEDFLRVYDEGEEEILATHSGDIFPHSIVFENQSSLTLKWTSLKLNSDLKLYPKGKNPIPMCIESLFSCHLWTFMSIEHLSPASCIEWNIGLEKGYEEDLLLQHIRRKVSIMNEFAAFSKIKTTCSLKSLKYQVLWQLIF